MKYVLLTLAVAVAGLAVIEWRETRRNDNTPTGTDCPCSCGALPDLDDEAMDPFERQFGAPS